MRAQYAEEEDNISNGRPTNDKYFSLPSENPPEHDIFIEWTYIIDLDRMAFSVDNGAHFALDNIPRGPASKDWIQCVGLDCVKKRCMPPWTPLEFIADMHPSIPIPDDDLIAYNTLEGYVQSIEPSEWTSSLSTAQKLAIQVGECVISGFYSTFSNVNQFEPINKAFR